MSAPTDDELHALLPTIIARLMKLRTRRAVLVEEMGQKVLTLLGAMPREATARQPLCAEIDGLSLHAAVRVEGHHRKRLEKLCR